MGRVVLEISTGPARPPTTRWIFRRRSEGAGECRPKPRPGHRLRRDGAGRFKRVCCPFLSGEALKKFGNGRRGGSQPGLGARRASRPRPGGGPGTSSGRPGGHGSLGKTPGLHPISPMAHRHLAPGAPTTPRGRGWLLTLKHTWETGPYRLSDATR